MHARVYTRNRCNAIQLVTTEAIDLNVSRYRRVYVYMDKIHTRIYVCSHTEDSHSFV